MSKLIKLRDKVKDIWIDGARTGDETSLPDVFLDRETVEIEALFSKPDVCPNPECVNGKVPSYFHTMYKEPWIDCPTCSGQAQLTLTDEEIDSFESEYYNGRDVKDLIEAVSKAQSEHTASILNARNQAKDEAVKNIIGDLETEKQMYELELKDLNARHQKDIQGIIESERAIRAAKLEESEAVHQKELEAAREEGRQGALKEYDDYHNVEEIK